MMINGHQKGEPARQPGVGLLSGPPS